MNEYESIIIVNPKTSEEERNGIVDKIKTCINENSTLKSFDDIGLKKLAYSIKEYKEGYYYVFYFESTEKVIHELERIYRITDEILKFMTIRKDD